MGGARRGVSREGNRAGGELGASSFSLALFARTDKLHIACKFLSSQVNDTVVEGCQLAMVVDGEAQQVCIGRLPMALHA